MLTLNEVLDRGVDKIYPSKSDLFSLMSKRKITIYQGFDPSMPSLHLGNFVGLLKLRSFQKLDHKVIFLIGDFTGMIGDPTDKLAARKKLTRKEVLLNCRSWKKQASKVIDFTGPNKAEIMFNSKWNDKLTFKDLVEISSNLTVQQMIERDMFQKRLKDNKPIYLHEFLYPVAQGYDSVFMNVDLEIGGSDQIFNMLIGRTLAKAIKGKEKYVLATKLLVDKDGNKVGKTAGNALFLDSTSQNFFGGIMSFPDEVLDLAFEILTEYPLDLVKREIKSNPMKAKKLLAFEVVKMLWGENAAKKSEASFENTFQKTGVPNDLPIIMINEKSLPLLDLIFSTKTIGSRSEVKRLISQKAIEVNGKIMTNPQEEVGISKKGNIIKIGKKIFVKVFQG